MWYRGPRRAAAQLLLSRTTKGKEEERESKASGTHNGISPHDNSSSVCNEKHSKHQ